MNSKEVLKKLINDIEEQGKIISTNNLIITFNINYEYVMDIYQNILKDLDRLEKYKKAIEILKDKVNLNVEETFFPPAYNDMSDYGEYDFYLSYFDEFINLQDYEYELLKEVLDYDCEKQP